MSARPMPPADERTPDTEAETTPRLALLLLLTFGLLVGGLLAEGLVRVFGSGPVLPRFVVDSGYGVRANQPGISTRHTVPGEYDVVVTTNSAGMRGQDREFDLTPPLCGPRVLVLGDSFIYGFGVEDEEVVSRVLEDLLVSRSPAGCSPQVLNLAVSGFGQAELLLTYRERGVPYSPDVVILFYFDNDIGNNAVSALFRLDGDDLVRTGSEYLPGVRAREILYGNPVTRALFTRSHAWNMLRNRLSSVVQNRLLEERGMNRFDDAEPQAVRLTEALVEDFLTEIAEDGAAPILAVIPQRGPPVSSNIPVDLEALRARGVPVVDGRDFLATSDYYERDSHWRAAGHRKMAEALLPIVIEGSR